MKIKDKHKPNIIIILIDALRKDHLSCYGYNKKTSPTIDSIAQSSIVFNNAFSCINATDPSITSLFTGKYPHHHGIKNHGYKITQKEIKDFLNKQLPSLQEILKKNGYKTYGLDWLGRWHKKGFDFYLGITDRSKKKKFVDKLNKFLTRFTLVHKLITRAFHSHIFSPLFEKLHPYPNGKKLTDKAIEIIKDQNKEKSFFMFIHYWDVHAPYICPNKKLIKKFIDKTGPIRAEPYLKNIQKKEIRKFYQTIINYSPYLNETLSRYDACINYADQQIKRLISQLKKTNQLKNTLLIFTSDHGESLIDHNILFDHHGLYDCTVRVPLIISHPKIKEKIEINHLFQHTDLLPTLLDSLNIRLNKNSADINFDGKSFLSTIEKKKDKKKREYIFLEEYHLEKKFAIRNEKYKLISGLDKESSICRRCGIIHGGMTEFYDLEDDPQEINNLYGKSAKYRPIIKKLKKILFKEIIPKRKEELIKKIKI